LKKIAGLSSSGWLENSETKCNFLITVWSWAVMFSSGLRSIMIFTDKNKSKIELGSLHISLGIHKYKFGLKV
jgi:hypothetical protein